MDQITSFKFVAERGERMRAAPGMSARFLRPNRGLKYHSAIVLAICWCLSGCGPAPRPVQEVTATSDAMSHAAPISIGDADWPWWRGPNGNNVASCQTAPTSWNEQDNVVWKTAVPGRGHGTPTIVGDQVFLCTADEARKNQSVHCFDRRSGDQQWQTVVHTGGFPGSGGLHAKSTHANCTVACDGDALFVGFLNADHVTASSLTLDGEIRWQTDLGFFVPKFGYAPSPCLFESLAMYWGDKRGGAFLAALDRETGDIVWRKARNNTDTYSSAIVVDVAGTPQLIISGDDRVASYNPMTGDELWSCPGTAEATCGTVVSWKTFVFASGGYPARQTVCIDATTGTKVWEDKVKSYEQSMLVANDHLFAITDDGIAMCWDAATGERKWKHRLSGPISASPVLVGHLIYATNEAGKTWIFEADTTAYRQVAENQLGQEAFASLAICDAKIFTRIAVGHAKDRKEYLYCLGDGSAVAE